MAIDYRIPMGVQTTASLRERRQPIITMQDVFERQDRDYEREKEMLAVQRKADEDLAIQQAFQQHRKQDGSPDYDAIVNTLSMRFPQKAMELQGVFAEGRAKAAKAKQDEFKVIQDKYAQGIKLAQGIYDQASLDQIAPQINQLSPEFGALLGTTYDKQKLDSLVNIAKTAEQIYKERRDAIDDFVKGDVQGGVIRYLRSAQSDEEYQKMLAEAQQVGVSDAVLGTLPKVWTPETKKQLDAMTMTFKDELAQRNTEADDRRSDRAVAVQERQASLAEQRGTRLAQAAEAAAKGGAAGLTPAQLETRRRQAVLWRQNQLAALERRRRGTMSADGEQLTAPMTQDAVDEEKARIQAGYYQLLGEAPPAGELPQGVKTKVKALRKKFSKIADARDELSLDMEDILDQYPDVDEQGIYAALDEAYAPAVPNAPPAAGQRQVRRGKWPETTRQYVYEQMKSAKFSNGQPMFPGIKLDDPKIDVFIANNREKLMDLGKLK